MKFPIVNFLLAWDTTGGDRHREMYRKAFSLVLMCLVVIIGCKGEPDVFTNLGPDAIEDWFDSSLPVETSPLVFTHLPVAIEDLGKVYPLGMAGSHVFPADHIYLEKSGVACAVYAPAGGKIHYIETPEDSSSAYNDYSIRIAVSKDVSYVFGHIMLETDLEHENYLRVGDMVEAGDRLGTFNPQSNLDLYVLDRGTKNSLANTKYPFTMLYAQNPFSYFTDDLRQQLYAKLLPPKPAGTEDGNLGTLQRHYPAQDAEHTSPYLALIEPILDDTATEQIFLEHYLDLRKGFSPIGGTFEYDREDSIQGNWFSPLADTKWGEGISFHFDLWYPSQPRVRIDTAFPIEDGKTRYALNLSQDGFIPFSEVGVGEQATYVVFDEDHCNWHGVPYVETDNLNNHNPLGLLLVKMESVDRIKVEVFAFNPLLAAEFTSNARYYYR